jgi:hypothetical protein
MPIVLISENITSSSKTMYEIRIICYRARKLRGCEVRCLSESLVSLTLSIY